MFKQSELAHGTRIKVNRGTDKHIDNLTRSVVYYSGKSYNLLPKIDEVQDETGSLGASSTAGASCSGTDS